MKHFQKDIYYAKEKRHRKINLWYHLFCIFTANCGEVYLTNLDQMSGLVYPTIKNAELNRPNLISGGCVFCQND